MDDDKVVDNMIDTDELQPQANDSPESIDNMAQEVEDVMQQQALESAMFFNGGEDAVMEYVNSPSFLNEAIISTVAKNNTIVKLNNRDDLKRRAMVASIVLGRRENHPLYRKVVLFRAKYLAAKKALFKIYGRRAYKVALASMRKHQNTVNSSDAPAFHKDKTGNRTTYNAVFHK